MTPMTGPEQSDERGSRPDRRERGHALFQITVVNAEARWMDRRTVDHLFTAERVEPPDYARSN